MIKKLSLILALILSATAITACESKKPQTESEDVTETSSKEGEEALGVPEDVRFDGETFSMLHCHNYFDDYYREEENGDLLNDAVIKRNRLTEERLGIKLNFVHSATATDQQGETQGIANLILAGDKTYDAYVQVQHSGMPGLINEGLFLNWYELPYIDFEKPWWYKNVIRDITFGDKVFAMTGDYNLASFSGSECLAFNKTLLDELDMEYPYQDVFDGTWTHDRFVEYIVAATKDLNGDGQMDYDHDRYGFGGWQYEQLKALYVGYGGVTLVKDDLQMPVLNIYSEQ